MNPLNKTPPALPIARPAADRRPAQPHRPAAAQPKMAAQAPNSPRVPPVYQSQPTPRVLQRKAAVPQQPQADAPTRRPAAPPAAPPVYRPQAGPKAVQPKMAPAAKQPGAPTVHGTQPVPKVLQTKTALVQSSRQAQSPRQPVAPPAYRPAGARPQNITGGASLQRATPPGPGAKPPNVIQRAWVGRRALARSGATAWGVDSTSNQKGLGFYHEHIFFTDGQKPSNIGFTTTGLFEDSPQGYTKVGGDYDDQIMRVAVEETDKPTDYKFLSCNCQDYVNNVLANYNKISARIFGRVVDKTTVPEEIEMIELT